MRRFVFVFLFLNISQVISADPSPLTCSSTKSAVINEILSAPVGDESQFVELSFKSETLVSNWSLKYAINNTTVYSVASFPANNTYVNGDYPYYELPSNKGLNPGSGEVVLLDSEGKVIDAWRYCKKKPQETTCPVINYIIPDACLNVIDDHSSSNKGIARIPDTSADPSDNTGDPTKGTNNDGGGGGSDPVNATGFNCVHSASGDSATGRLYTRIAGTAFNVNVHALNSSGATETDYANAEDGDRTVTVELVKDNGGSCGSSLDTPVSWDETFTDLDNGVISSSNVTVSKAYPAVRCKVTDNSGDSTVIGCSSDSFAIRPSSLILSTPVLNNSGATGLPVAKAGDAFTLEVATVAGYNGTPQIAGSLDAHAGGIAGTLTGNFSAADPATGTATGTDFTYSEVGNFRFPADTIIDDSFTLVDQTTDCVDNSYENTLNGDGKIGCDFSNDAETDWVGRFTPDHFHVAISNDGELQNTCISGGFSYAGTAITYNDDPVMTITAQNAADVTTQNYVGDYAKLDIGDVVIPIVTEDGTQLGADGINKVSLTWTPGSPSLTNAAGVLTLTLTGDTFEYGRADNDHVAPFVPDIVLFITEVKDADDVEDKAGLLPLSFTLDAAANGLSSVYGRLSLTNAFGSELQTLPMPMQVEFYNGAANGFQRHAADVCTVINNITITDSVVDDLVPAETCIWDTAGASGSFSCAGGEAADQYSETPVAAGFNLNFKAPGEGNTGVLNITVEDSPDYLDYDWSGTGNFDQNPAATATFGIHNTSDGQMIFMKEVR